MGRLMEECEVCRQPTVTTTLVQFGDTAAGRVLFCADCLLAVFMLMVDRYNEANEAIQLFIDDLVRYVDPDVSGADLTFRLSSFMREDP
jgi:hypothetical protein